MRILETSGTKLEQFFDIVLHHKLENANAEPFFDEIIYKHCAQGDYMNLPVPFSLAKNLPVPFLMQLIIIPSTPPEDENADPTAKYFNIVKHVYLHKNKLPVNMCVEACRGVAHKWTMGGTTGWGYWQ